MSQQPTTGEAQTVKSNRGQVAEPEILKTRMVGWHDPGQLLQTARQVVISSILGRHIDRRLLESLTIKAEYYDFSGPVDEKHEKEREDVVVKAVSCPLPDGAEEVWIDYVSDVGDGWNSTYAIAHYLAQPRLEIKDAGQSLPRGNLLIFGGDGVYPTADRDSYRERLQKPYDYAYYNDRCAPEPYAFALPGNHDWYDSLSSFSEIFSSWVVREFCAWKTPQSRSYFAIKLPHNWWLLGVDVQLTHDIDEPQVKYFEDVIEHRMKDGDRIIFCCSEPFWVYYELMDEKERKRLEDSRMFHLIGRLEKQKMAVYLAGDLHHYYRVRDAVDGQGNDGALKITAGGGGAFLHPTHGEIEQAYRNNRTSDAPVSYPDPKKSRELCNRNISFWSKESFPIKNWRFGVLTAILYSLTAWFMLAGVGREGREKLIDRANDAVDGLASLFSPQPDLMKLLGAMWHASGEAWGGALFNSPFLTFLAAAIILGFVVFTDARKLWYRLVGGTAHAVTHLLAASFIGWLGCWVYVAMKTDWFGLDKATVASLEVKLVAGTLALLLILLLGFIAGLCIMGFYLWFSLNVLGHHSNEAFSALRIEDWKNFLRIRIDSQGNLTVFPIGILRVPRAWRKAEKNDRTCSAFVPDRQNDSNYTEPSLIEPPLHYPPR